VVFSDVPPLVKGGGRSSRFDVGEVLGKKTRVWVKEFDVQ